MGTKLKSDTETALETIGALTGQITEMRQMLAEAAKPATKATTTPTKLFAAPRDLKEENRHGFNCFGEFAMRVKDASSPNGFRDNRLYATKATTGMSEGQSADGGFLIPPEFSNTIFERVYTNDLLTRTDKYNVTGNNFSIPAIDEQSRVDGSRFGGVLSYWLDEAQQITKSKPSFRRINFVLKKLAVLAYTTEELLQDSSIALDQYLTKVFAEEIQFNVGSAILNGNGVGKPLGILSAPSMVQVPILPGQATKTVLFENIVAMWSRLWLGSKKNAVWLVHQDVTPQLYALSLGVGAAGVAAYMPPNGLSENPYATLMGRPVLEVEFCQTLGTNGDIYLVDLSQYATISKGSVDNQMSMHLRFDYDELVFRCIYRIDGQPLWNTALTPYTGANTQSPFITLATR